MRILICGGAGYIGSHALKFLQSQGHACRVLDNLSTGHQWAVRGAPLHIIDLLDRKELLDFFKTYPVDVVMHLCARSLVGESCSRPDIYYQNNVVGTLNLLDAMRQSNVNTLIFSSTAAIFGNPVTPAIAEDHPRHPLNPYGHSKLMIEQILSDYHRAYGLNAVALRYFNAAGADPAGELGEAHDPETHLIPNVIRSALARNDNPLQLFGGDYDTRDGTCVRDYVHVNDIASAHSLALDYLLRNPGCHQFNLGTTTGHSVLEVIRACELIIGSQVSYEKCERRPGDPPVLVCDNTLAIRELGWQPSNSSLENIVRTAARWELSRQPALRELDRFTREQRLCST